LGSKPPLNGKEFQNLELLRALKCGVFEHPFEFIVRHEVKIKVYKEVK
jgi:hypothetical protein